MELTWDEDPKLLNVGRISANLVMTRKEVNNSFIYSTRFPLTANSPRYNVFNKLKKKSKIFLIFFLNLKN
jgi:hypothetical protein